jgi:exodeoxyribonuclease V alpha subunit
LNNCIVELKDNHRFAPDRGLGLSAAAIRELPDFPSVELLESVISRLKQDSTGEISISPLPAVYGGEFKNALHHTVRTMQVHKKPGENIPFLSYLEQDTIGEAFELFNRFRILCVHRRGIYGAIAVNQMIESFMAASGASGRFYKGKPIMITENNQEMKLFNGDVGLIWTDETGKLKAFFPDASGEQEGFRSFDVNTLPPFETVYAMTVHKAQGSGFQNILIICPPTVSPLMTREMIYTAITRAKKQAIIWSDESVLIEALRHRTSRHSNLAEKIQKSP